MATLFTNGTETIKLYESINRGNWTEGRFLPKGASPFTGMVRYKETKTSVSIFTPENIAALLTKADDSLKPFLALSLIHI